MGNKLSTKAEKIKVLMNDAETKLSKLTRPALVKTYKAFIKMLNAPVRTDKEAISLLSDNDLREEILMVTVDCLKGESKNLINQIKIK
jgi:hypothetical protein